MRIPLPMIRLRRTPLGTAAGAAELSRGIDDAAARSSAGASGANASRQHRVRHTRTPRLRRQLETS